MAFKQNPLSLSVPQHSFETWLRDNNYLEIVDQKTTQLHHLTTTTTTTTPTTATSSFSTLFSLFTLNPFSKLTTSDFRVANYGGVGWTFGGFLGSFGCYSFPSSSLQAQMRVHENVKRFVFHYLALFLVFFASSLYQMPLALVGLLSCLALWELFRYCDKKWSLVRFPLLRRTLIRTAQCAVAILFFSNVQMAAFYSMAVGYAGLTQPNVSKGKSKSRKGKHKTTKVMLLHSSFRKLTLAPQQLKGRGRRGLR